MDRWAEAEDVLQNASIRLLRALREIVPPSMKDFYALAALQIRRELLDLVRHLHGPLGLATHQDSRGGDSHAPPDPADLSHEPSELAQWREFHEAIDRLVALKTLACSRPGSKQLARFQVEAAALRRSPPRIRHTTPRRLFPTRTCPSPQWVRAQPSGVVATRTNVWHERSRVNLGWHALSRFGKRKLIWLSRPHGFGVVEAEQTASG